MYVVTLIPKDKRAKQIIQNHGNRWEVVKQLSKVLFDDKPGPWFLVVPLGEQRVATSIKEAQINSASRWVHALFDHRFIIAP